MGGYWSRHRLVYSLVASIAVALISSLLFAFPFINQRAKEYNSQSIYKKSGIDFIAPEPSMEQVEELPGNNGIDRVFPYFITKMDIDVNGKSRATNVLLSDRMQNMDMTMYCDARLIEKGNSDVKQPAYVDWSFANDLGIKTGDSFTLTIAGSEVDYMVAAIYETNSVYDEGAILLPITAEQKEIIRKNASNNGYSGMYVAASDYAACKTYLTTEYRPLGRLKDRVQFGSDEQYQIHYNAIMDSGYANEITDFRIKKSNAESGASFILVAAAALLSIATFIIFNLVMYNRGDEKVYFTKNSIPKGQNVLPYYKITFGFELFILEAVFVAGLLLRIMSSKHYIPREAISPVLVIIPIAYVLAEIICVKMNGAKVKVIEKQVEEQRKKKQAEQHKGNEQQEENRRAINK